MSRITTSTIRVLLFSFFTMATIAYSPAGSAFWVGVPYGYILGESLGRHHQAITREALHEQIGDAAYVTRDGQALAFTSLAIDELMEGNADIDLSHLTESNPIYHCDDSRIPECSKRLKEQLEFVAGKIYGAVSDVQYGVVPTVDYQQIEYARWFFGGALHTLQDFYSHSNWVEMGNGAIHPGFGVEIVGMTKRMTYAEAECAPDSKTILETNRIISGEYHDHRQETKELLEQFFARNEETGFNRPAKGLCIHGNKFNSNLNTSSTICSIKDGFCGVIEAPPGFGVNKDWTGRKSFPQAKALAVKATRDYFQKLVAAVEQYCPPTQNCAVPEDPIEAQKRPLRIQTGLAAFMGYLSDVVIPAIPDDIDALNVRRNETASGILAASFDAEKDVTEQFEICSEKAGFCQANGNYPLLDNAKNIELIDPQPTLGTSTLFEVVVESFNYTPDIKEFQYTPNPDVLGDDIVTYRATSGGFYNEGTVEINIGGPDLRLIFDGEVLDSGPRSSLIFLQAGLSFAEREYTLINVGNEPITLDHFNSSNSNFTVTGSAGLMLEPDVTTTFTVRYDRVPVFSQTNVNIGQQNLTEYDLILQLFGLVYYSGTYNVWIQDSSRDSGLFVCNGSSNIAMFVEFLPDTFQYRVNFAGNEIILDYSAQGSITANQFITVPDDGGTTSENLTISIDVYGNISGSSTWTWQSDDGSESCSGTSTYGGNIISAGI